MTATVESDTQPATGVTRRRLTFVVVGAVIALVVAIAAVAAFGRQHRLSAAPYSDPASTGLLTLCGQDGRAITDGSVNSAPAIWRAVAATPTPSAAGSSATLYAYQPRQGVPAGQWTGQMVTAPSTFTNAAHPMAQATKADIALKDFLTAYPTQWKGTVQLRLYIGGSGSGVQTQHYDTADLVVDGSSWRVLKAGNASCTNGSATSLETLTGVAGS